MSIEVGNMKNKIKQDQKAKNKKHCPHIIRVPTKI